MYFITTFKKLEKNKLGFWDTGSTRTVGYFEKLEDAQYRVENNVCDLCETIYNYALIEGVEKDTIYPNTYYQQLYKVKDITKKGEDGKDYYNFDLTYEKIDAPENFFNGYSIVIG